jgi:integrase/recombinase XerC
MTRKKTKKKIDLPPNVRRHGSGFRAVFTVSGSRVRSPTFETADAAVAWKADYFEAELRPSSQPLELTLAGGLQLILDDCDATGARDGTIAFYRDHSRTLFTHFGRERHLHAIASADVSEFIRKRRAAGVSASTIVKKELQVLKRMFALARDHGFPLPLDPFADLRLPRVRSGRFDFLVQDRIAELVMAMRRHKAPLAKWHADIVEMLFSTGLRRAELLRLRASDIDFAAGRILVDGKTRPRYQTFGASLEPVLRRLVEAAGKGGILVAHPTGLEQAFQTWQRRLGEPRLTPHVLRHSYGTAMAQHVTPFELMGLMGHSSLTQTSRYFHARGDAVRGALDRLRLGPPDPAPSGADDLAGPPTEAPPEPR